MNPVRIVHLYPHHMNLYGDRGNVICLEARCRWRGIPVEVHDVGPDAPFDPENADIVFIGGGPDREQLRIAGDLTGPKAAAILQAVEAGVVFLAVCGGYQLFGHYYKPAGGENLRGLGVLDIRTEHPGFNTRRCIGNLVAACAVPLSPSSGSPSAPAGDRFGRVHPGPPRRGAITASPGSAVQTLVGFENHGGRTYLGHSANPLAQVIAGYGNNGEDSTEGAWYKNTFGTYLHGSFLPKNPHFADHLIALALARRQDTAPLAALDDEAEGRAHAAAVKLAMARR